MCCISDAFASKKSCCISDVLRMFCSKICRRHIKLQCFLKYQIIAFTLDCTYCLFVPCTIHSDNHYTCNLARTNCRLCPSFVDRTHVETGSLQVDQATEQGFLTSLSQSFKDDILQAVCSQRQPCSHSQFSHASQSFETENVGEFRTTDPPAQLHQQSDCNSTCRRWHKHHDQVEGVWSKGAREDHQTILPFW